MMQSWAAVALGALFVVAATNTGTSRKRSNQQDQNPKLECGTDRERMDPRVWGKHGWAILYYLANLADDNSKDFSEFFKHALYPTFVKTIPCDKCHNHALQFKGSLCKPNEKCAHGIFRLQKKIEERERRVFKHTGPWNVSEKQFQTSLKKWRCHARSPTLHKEFKTAMANVVKTT